MASQKQREAAKRNMRKAQKGARQKGTAQLIRAVGENAALRLKLQ